MSALFAATLTAALAPATPAAAQSRSRAPEPFLHAAEDPLLIMVSLKRQRLRVFDRTGAIVATSPISSGTSGHETPEGVFSIIQKEEDHRSNIYDDASMPFMQRITWSGIALHAGALPGYPASHGCIRLPYGFAERFFKVTRLNTRVVVTPYETDPAVVAHPVLFQPRLGEEIVAQSPERRRAPALAKADGGAEAPMMLGVRPGKPEAEALQSTRPLRTLADATREAQAWKVSAAEAAVAAARTLEGVKAGVKQKQAEAQKAERSIKAAEANVKRAEARVLGAEREIAGARSETGLERARANHAKALDAYAAAANASADVKQSLAAKLQAAREATDAIKAAEAANTAAQNAARVAAREVEPISVFVSRKTGRLYIRQARQPVVDLPVTIRDPGKPIGTHVFTAMTSTDGDTRLVWNAVAVESNDIPPPVTQQQDRRGRWQKIEPQPVSADLVRRSALAALDRIEIPQATLDRILPHVRVGSSLLISDLPQSIETGPSTDFVVLTKGEAEAVASIQRFVAEQREKSRGERSERRRRYRYDDDN